MQSMLMWGSKPNHMKPCDQPSHLKELISVHLIKDTTPNFGKHGELNREARHIP
jgi:hypothetical protein